MNTIQEAGPTDLAFMADLRYAAALADCRAGAVLVPADYGGEAPMPVLRAPRPRLAFARAVALLAPAPTRPSGVHATALVPRSCTLGAGVWIGAYTVLGEDVRVGAGTAVHAHCALYDGVTIGADCEIHSHVAIRAGVTLGDRVLVQNGVVIGADGFGFEPTEDGRYHKVPQVGTVRIADDVEVQANACVDRAAIGATVIGRGTKIDNLTQVAHGCTIGEDSILCGQVGLSGSTQVGNRVLLGGQVGVADHMRIGDGARVAAQSGVIQDLPGDRSYGGTPTMDLKDALRAALFLSRLPEIARDVKKLKRAVDAWATGDGGACARRHDAGAGPGGVTPRLPAP